MVTAALDLNDADLALVANGVLLRQEPGYAALENGALRFGERAASISRLRPLEASSRYWRELDDSPMPRALGALRTPADLVHAHLASFRDALGQEVDGVVAAVPSYWSTQQLGLLLGIAREIGLPLVGLVNAAVASTRRPCPDRHLWHLDISLHDVALTSIVQDGRAALGNSRRHAWLSAQLLDRVCARAIAQGFLRTSRFDPFHDAATEQELHDRLGAWLAALRAGGTRELTMTFRGNEFRASVGPQDIRGAVAAALEPLLQTLRALCPAGSFAVLQVPDRLASYPGALDALAGLPGWETVVLEPAAAAFGALRAGRASGPVQLATSLPWDQPPVTAQPRAAQPANKMGAPTHVVHRGRAWRIGATPLTVGTEIAEGEFGIELPSSVQAVSRRHCTVLVEQGRVLVHDHSRYGTRLNGHRIEGSAVLHAGDALQVGQPPLELFLVGEVDHGPQA